MPSLSDRFLQRLGLQRSFNPFTPAEWAAINAGMAGSYIPRTTMNNKQEQIGQGFTSLTTYAYANNPVVFACEDARVKLFSEARFQWQSLEKGRPGKLWSNASLGVLEKPYPGGTTGQMLKDWLLDADLGGNGLIARRPGMFQRLRPDWTVIIAGSDRPDATTWDLDVEILGYGYQPDGPMGGKPWEYLQRSEVAHLVSTRNPLNRFSGMPWLLPALREIQSDQAAISYKQMYFENAATPNLLVKFAETMTEAAADTWVKKFTADHAGATNAYKTLFLGGGADAVVVGSDLAGADMTNTTESGELRIASAAGVPPVIVGLGAALGAEAIRAYAQARRAFADLTIRPLWRDMAGAMETLVPAPSGSRLWFDDRDISFLQEDVKDAADIQAAQAGTIRNLVDGGYEPASVVDAVIAGDFQKLVHMKLWSVQLQPPGTTAAPPAPAEAEQPPMLMNGAERGEVRCPSCNRLVGVRTAPGGAFEIKCRGCSNLVAA